MKIGIITLPLHFNYGGILQAYALQKVLRDQGHEVEHIECIHKKVELSWKKKPFVYTKRIILKYILRRKDIVVDFESYLQKTESIVCQHTNRFMDKHIKRRFVNTFFDVKENEYDAFIVGSDQIWRKGYLNSHKDGAFLDFTQNWKVKRLSYAASFGSDKWLFDKEETASIKKLVSKFDAVSVRELSGITLCEQFLNTNAVKVLDPTLLLDRNVYDQLIPADAFPSNGDLLCYILDENETSNQVVKQLENEGYKSFRVNSKAEDRKASLSSRIQPPIEDWLKGFRDAKFVVTDSFHACVFSIIYNKPFVCIGNQERGMDRFVSLLEMFSLSDRLVCNINEIDIVQKNYIDWNVINDIIKKNINTSKSFILQYLNE